jgi:hypothetical protein
MLPEEQLDDPRQVIAVAIGPGAPDPTPAPHADPAESQEPVAPAVVVRFRFVAQHWSVGTSQGVPLHKTDELVVPPSVPPSAVLRQ